MAICDNKNGAETMGKDYLLFVDVNTYCKLFLLFVLKYSTFCNILIVTKGGI